MKTGIKLIVLERKEQFTKHCRSVEYDVKRNSGQQLRKAAVLLISLNPQNSFPPGGWDENLWNKMCRKSYRERLIIAGALIAAEIDRLNYLGIK